MPDPPHEKQHWRKWKNEKLLTKPRVVGREVHPRVVVNFRRFQSIWVVDEENVEAHNVRGIHGCRERNSFTRHLTTHLQAISTPLSPIFQPTPHTSTYLLPTLPIFTHLPPNSKHLHSPPSTFQPPLPTSIYLPSISIHLYEPQSTFQPAPPTSTNL